MKRILTILFVFLSVASFGQIYQAMPQPGYGPVKRMRIDSVLSIPIGIPNLRNITGGIDTGQVRYVTSDSSIYVFTGSTWVKAGGSGGGPSTPDTIVAKYPIRIDTTGVRDTIFLAQNFLDSVYNGTVGFGTGLISAPVLQTDTVINVLSPIVWKRNGTVLTQSVGQAFPITRASSNNYRTDVIYITGADTLGYIQGVESLLNPAVPVLPVDGILITYVNVFDSTTVTTSGPPSTYQRTAVVYIDANTGQLATDSVSFNWNQTNKALTINGGLNITGPLSNASAPADSALIISTAGQVKKAAIGGGGGGGGTVTSVSALTLGTSGTDLNSTVANSTTTPVITLNVPNASLTARGVLTTGAQSIAGLKSFDSARIDQINIGRGKFTTLPFPGQTNLAIGFNRADNPIFNTLAANTTGIENIAIGTNTMYANTTGSRNVAIGNSVLSGGTVFNNNVAIGRFAMSTSNAGDSNVAIGASAMGTLLNGNNNTAVGTLARQGIGGLTTGNNNTAIGHYALGGHSSGDNNTVVGRYSLSGSGTVTTTFTGSNNTVVGSNILTNVTSLSGNVILADGQGNIRFRNTGSVSYLDGSVAIGISPAGVTPASPNASAALDITSTTRGFLPPRMDSSQMVGITAPATGLQVYNTTDSNNYIYDGLSWKSNWLTGGNSGVNASQFIGSRNNASVRFRANNTESFYIDSSNASINLPTPSSAAFQSSRILRFFGTGATANSQTGYIQYEGGGGSNGGAFNIFNSNGGINLRPSNGDVFIFGGTPQIYSTSGGLRLTNNSTNSGFLLGNYGPQTSGTLLRIVNNYTVAGETNPFVIFPNGNIKMGQLASTFIDSGYTADITGNAVRISNTPGTSTPNSTVLLELRSTDRGFLPPKMTGAQVEAITGPAEGLMVYATSAGTGAITSKGWWGYDGTTWVKLN